MSEIIKTAMQTHEDRSVFGNLNILFAGHPAQLPPPKSRPLYDHCTLACYKGTSDLNGLNTQIKCNVEGLVVWHQVDKCIMLEKIMHQKDPLFQSLLGHLCYGVCTQEDFAFLNKFVIKNCNAEKNNDLLNVKHWMDNPDFSCPLIRYTNAVVKSRSGLHLRSTSDTSDIPYSFTPILFRFLISLPTLLSSYLPCYVSVHPCLSFSAQPFLFPCD